MAKYSKSAGKKVEEAIHEMQEGKLKSGRSNKPVTSRKQAIAIGLSEAREEGAKVPDKKSSGKAAPAGSKGTAKKPAVKKAASSKAASPKKTVASKVDAKKSGAQSSSEKPAGRGKSGAVKKQL